jgi:hypothetical protein
VLEIKRHDDRVERFHIINKRIYDMQMKLDNMIEAVADICTFMRAPQGILYPNKNRELRRQRRLRLRKRRKLNMSLE